MEAGEERNKLQGYIPWIPTTPLKPILPRPVPIYIPGEENQLGSHVNGAFACFEPTASVDINGRPHFWSAPSAEVPNTAGDNARTRVKISFENGSSSSNGFAELLPQANTPPVHTNATTFNDYFMNQFAPTWNSDTLLSQSHLSRELSLINTINYNNQDPFGTSYFPFYSKNTSQVAPPTPDIAIGLESRQVAAMQMHIEERDQRGDQRNVQATMCNNESPLNKELCDSVTEFAAISTPCKENHNQNKEISHDIDLNKAPTSKPRRRKHRPKVIKEGKPKRTRKPVTPKPVQSRDTPTGKRKYVRRQPSTPQTEVTGERTEPLTPECAKRTCRRSLYFDIGDQQRDENSAYRESATTYFGGEIGLAVEETQALHNYKSLHEETQAPSRYLSKSNLPGANPNGNSAKGSSKRKGLMTAWDGHENSATILSKSVAQSSPNDSNSRSCGILTPRLQTVGSKRKHNGTIEHADTSDSNLIEAQNDEVQAYYQGSWIQFPNIQKKRRSEKGKNPNASGTSFGTTTKDAQLATCPQNVRSQQTKRRSRVPTRKHQHTSLSLIRNYDTELTHTAQQLGSSDRQTFGNAESPQTCIDALAAQMDGSLTKKKRTKKRSALVSSAFSCTNEIQQHHKFVLENHSLHLDNSLDVDCEEIWKNIHAADALTERFTHLNINREARELVLYGQNALIPYSQQNQKHKGLVHEDGTIVPFKGSFDPIRKQLPRPKVDLDEETNRVWKLLMLDINSHGVDGTDEDKAKWWEEERNVFRGRADSFIARMHLVQGDRRFSQWKGSVVDSVVGVFLTQNVSDHLSSSAFISLAARFPLKSSSNYKTYHEESTSLIPQVHIVEPEENTKLDEKILNQSVYEMSSMTINFIEHSEKKVVNSNDSCKTTGSLISLTDESNCKLLEMAQREIREQHSPMESGQISAMTEEGQENSRHAGVRKGLNDAVSSHCSVITSQISGDFSIDQNPEKIGSSSDSNSEVDDLPCAAKCNIFNDKISFSELLEMASSTMLHEVDSQSIDMKHDNLTENFEKSNVTRGSLEACILPCDEYTLKMTPDSGVLEVNCFDPFKEEASSSGFSKNKDENDMRRPSFPTESESQAAIAHSQSMASQLHHQQSNHNQQNAFHISGQTQDPMQKAGQINFGKHNDALSHENSKTNSAPIKLTSKEHRKDIHVWDSLRTQAQAKAGKREKTENTVDSLDWDAVRRADVKEIAGAIKERGMNNMLAERIQNFLNRLVKAHGAIDLEWLRDVPPDQAKEYLLSITGLGLKSVECVRLLTLHNLAFPVDTNVGRIAVRLGWVPLQPLPESLQLHLLELYPVLESIQKYLWPRLCKLDQRTLYELHYQLITFGKVFCTKSKPNCNACPMRGECRHFASAFASARLALPGPEQRSIVMTAGNNPTYQNPSVIINQLPLPLPENTSQAEALRQTEASMQLEAKSEINVYQPIIEEPATPEPECSQVSENDIEDAFYEESCEIPNIDLNMEEFTLNLQNYVQENMELQEGEMSKALVALNPEAACIPTPKLKNISRLRTEHCVYELPDSHPLLEGWDKREPDDPGKYLLAIWTPGETANSIQPPERKCSFQDCDQLCNEKECLSCNSFREASSQIVRGTLLIPCRTAMRGSFPLNGTYFQVNEVFADHDSSLNPISVPRSWIWSLNRRTVYFGTSVPTIFKGLSTQEIQQCFWRGYVCVRGFDRETRAPRPLKARLHFPASKLAKNKEKKTRKGPNSANLQELNLEPNPEQPELLLNIQNLQEKGGA